MVKLTPEQQPMVVAAEPEISAPVPGGWGCKDSTHVRLRAADAATLRSVLEMAWRNVAPKGLPAPEGRKTSPKRGAGASVARGRKRV